MNGPTQDEVRPTVYHMKAARFPTRRYLWLRFCGQRSQQSLGASAQFMRVHEGRRGCGADRGPGTSRPHVTTALGIQAIEHHRKGARFCPMVELVNALEQEKAHGKAGKIAEALTKFAQKMKQQRSAEGTEQRTAVENRGGRQTSGMNIVETTS